MGGHAAAGGGGGSPARFEVVVHVVRGFGGSAVAALVHGVNGGDLTIVGSSRF